MTRITIDHPPDNQVQPSKTYLKKKVCVGKIVAAHGIHGLVKLKSFTEPPHILVDYNPLVDRHATYGCYSRVSDHSTLIGEIDQIHTRAEAQTVIGTLLYTARQNFAALHEEDEFYHTDLIDLDVETIDGKNLGRLKAIHDFGAGPFLEILLKNGADLLLPFTRRAVPLIDLAQGRLVIDPPSMSSSSKEESTMSRRKKKNTLKETANTVHPYGNETVE